MTPPNESPGQTSRLRSLLVGAGTALFLVLGAFLLIDGGDSAGSSEPAPNQADGPLEPDLEIEDAVISQFRPTGGLRYRLHSPRIEHFQDDALTELIDPDLTLYSEDEPPWQMTARRGSILNATFEGNSREVVHLEEDVQMEQLFADGREYRLQTPAITIHPDREYAETDRNVMITSHAGRTAAVGLKGNLRRGRLHLFSDVEQRVHTILLPDQFK